jgi:Immunity protein 26
MIKKSEITHGAIFAMPLWNNLGYLYGKMLFGSHLKNELGRKKNIYIKVYDYYTEDSQEDFKQDFFKEKELFTDPFILAGFPKLRGENSWKFLKHDPIYEEDEFIPDYWQPGMIGELNIPADKEYGIVKCGNLQHRTEYFPYYRIKHLPIHRHKSYDAISLYLTFEWLRRNDMDVDAPFQYNDGLDSKREIRFEVMNMTVDYRTIPKELRGRVAPEKID